MTKPPPAKPAVQQGHFLPPLWFWLVFALCLAGVAWFYRPGNPDGAITNIVTLIGAFVVFMSLLVWFTLFSGWPWVVRLMPGVLCLGVVVALAGIYRFDGFSGNLLPRFRPRWAPPSDALLETPNEKRVAQIPDAAQGAAANDENMFPRFLGPGGDSRIAGVYLERDWKAHPPVQLWRTEVGAGWSGFIAAHGYAFTLEQRGDAELTTCYDMATGDLVWSHKVEGRHESVLGGVGPRSTPTFAAGKLYCMGAAGVLRCLQASNGEELWRKDLVEMFVDSPAVEASTVSWGRAGSPLVTDKWVIAPAGGPKDGKSVSLVAFDRETGDEAWRAGDDVVSYCSPQTATLAGQQQIIYVSENKVTGYPLPEASRETSTETPTQQQPNEDARPIVIQPLWSRAWPGSSTGAASATQPHVIGDNQLFISKGYGTGAMLLNVSNDDGEFSTSVEWESTNVMKTKFANVLLDRRYGVAYGLSDGVLECIDYATGEQLWRGGRYGHGQILGVGDVILVQAESGEVAMVDFNPDEFIELGQIDALPKGGYTWNNLCLYGDKLLVRNGAFAACYRLQTRPAPAKAPQ